MTEEQETEAQALKRIKEQTGVPSMDAARFILALERGEIEGDVQKVDAQGRDIPPKGRS